MNQVDWIGFIGVFLILLAYILNIFGKLERQDLRFIVLNFIGAGLACYASVLMDYMPFEVLEGVWAFASFIALLKYIKTTGKNSSVN